jgi:hypothetical protein
MISNEETIAIQHSPEDLMFILHILITQPGHCHENRAISWGGI